MTRFAACVIVLLAAAALDAAHPLEGKWVGSVDSDRGQMQFGLELKDEKGQLVGSLKTAHGDWPVKRVSESKGTFTVTFTSGDQEGKLVGTVKDGKFSGDWDNRPAAKGTFELTKTAPKTQP
jgi:hypothetical protein